MPFELYGRSRSRRSTRRPLMRQRLCVEPLESRSLLDGGSISGLVFDDTNGNGALDDGERGLAGWPAYLESILNGTRDDGEPIALTNDAGAFRFDGLMPASYFVALELPEGWQQTLPGEAQANVTGREAAIESRPRVPRIIDGIPIPHIVGGVPTDEPQFPSVGIVGNRTSNYCSGTLIDPRHVLTAAHCSDGVAPNDGRFTITSPATAVYTTSQITIHPLWTGGVGEDNSDDLAVWELASGVTGVEPSPLLRAAPDVGQVLTLVGYGYGGAGAAGDDGTFGAKRVGTNTIDRVSDGLVHWHFERTDPPESNTAPGDSGGANFIEQNGQIVVAAVTSGGDDRHARFGDHAFSTRVDVYADWIDAVVAGTAPPTCTGAPSAQAVPSLGENALRILASTGSFGDHPERLVELRTSPAVAITIGGTSGFISGLDFSPAGVLYGANTSLRTIDPESGHSTAIGLIHTATEPILPMLSIAFAPAGSLYGVSQGQRLYSIDPATALATDLGRLPSDVRGIDFAPDGRLFGITQSDLYLLDPTTGAAVSRIGDLAQFVGGDIDFAADGAIYSVDYLDGSLYSIDPATATQTRLGRYALSLWGVATESAAGTADRDGMYAVTIPCPDQSVGNVRFGARLVAPDTTAPTVRELRRVGDAKRTTGIAITFSEQLAPAGAADSAAYRVSNLAEWRWSDHASSSARPVRIRSIEYDASRQTVTLWFRKPLGVAAKTLRLLIADGKLTDVVGNTLDGDNDRNAGGKFVYSISGPIAFSFEGRHRLPGAPERSATSRGTVRLRSSPRKVDG